MQHHEDLARASHGAAACRRSSDSVQPPPMVQITTSNNIAAACWSTTKEDTLATCCAATSGVTVWNASTGAKNLTLMCSTRANPCPGPRGLQAVQTLKVYVLLIPALRRCAVQCVGIQRQIWRLHVIRLLVQGSSFMLAAGGHSGVVHLWDFRASKAPCVSLRVPGTDVVTALHGCSSSGRLLAATSGGDLHLWDLRLLPRMRPQIFGAHGASCGGEATTRNGAATLMEHPTPLPEWVQLRLCLSTFDSCVMSGMYAVGAPGVGFNNYVSHFSTTALVAKPAVFVVASGITQLVPDPTQPDRVAFALASGAVGAIPTPPS